MLWGHTQKFSGLTPGPVAQESHLMGLGDHMLLPGVEPRSTTFEARESILSLWLRFCRGVTEYLSSFFIILMII